MLKFAVPAVAALALAAHLPAPAQADTRDALAGAVVGGAIVGLIAHEKAKQKERNAAAARVQVVTRPPAAPTSRASYSAASAEVRQVQTALNYFDFPAGPADGVRGSQTRTGISTYQAYMNYPVTGTLTQFETSVLLDAYGDAQAPDTAAISAISTSPEGRRALLERSETQIAAGNG